MKNKDVELHIEQIVLHNLPRIDGDAFGHALRGELHELIAEGGVPNGLGAVSTVDKMSGRITISPGLSETGIATQVARLVYRKLGE